MRNPRLTSILLALLLLSACSGARESAPKPATEPASRPATATETAPETFVYRSVGGKQLELRVQRPQGHRPHEHPRPALVLFHGGGWTSGSPVQFARQANWLTTQTGVIVIAVQYRTKALAAGSSPLEGASDASAALCWVRDHAGELGIDPLRIAAGGGSAGGQLAVATTLPGAATVPECGGTAPAPAALLLLNPVLDLSRYEDSKHFNRSLVAVSPLQAMHKPLPPTLILQGTADTTAPLATTRRFVLRAEALGSKQVELVEFPGRVHGFFNNEENGDLEQSMREVKRFLDRLGWLAADTPAAVAPARAPATAPADIHQR